MAGLATAWSLSEAGHRCTVYERAPVAGMAAHSRDFGQLFETDTAVMGDIPSRMFNRSLWPSVYDLYFDAGVEIEPVDHRQTFYNDDETLLKIRLPYDAVSLLKTAIRPKSRRLIGDLKRFQEIGNQSLQSGSSQSETFGSFLKTAIGDKLSATFLNCFLIPALTTTVFTCPSERLLEFPCDIVLKALKKIVVAAGDGNELLRTRFGTFDVADRLLQNVAELQLDTSVIRVVQQNDNRVSLATSAGKRTFDHVVVATQANHVKQFCDDAKAIELLDQFCYVDVPVAAHTDESVMPAKKSDWTTFNFRTKRKGDSFASMCTVWMNAFHASWPESPCLLQSIFPSEDIDASKIICEAKLQRPVVNDDSERLLSRLDEVHRQPNRRIWFAGSYAARGVPLLESAVVSSNNVVAKILARSVSVGEGSS